ncbi:REP-associated tyrosine transposase [Casimicrobium huifangae]|uniref:REP-associated tyrosine transposase n=1 Tax=Casimicrobium huifangae TaxID=2591109 RepID=UPI0012EBA77C|nr:transposase [Casimicrobium huifangae]
MVAYRRNFVAGGTYFFTVTLRDRRSPLLVERIEDLRAAYHRVRCERPFTTDAIVVLPDHLHCIWTLPPGDADYAGRWKAIKARFTSACRRAGVALTRDDAGAYDLWQRRYWEHTIRDERDFEGQVNYIQYNPVKHGHADTPGGWPHSSFHRYVRNGLLPPNWAVAPELDVPE